MIATHLRKMQVLTLHSYNHSDEIGSDSFTKYPYDWDNVNGKISDERLEIMLL